jgi:hypothetical protein
VTDDGTVLPGDGPGTLTIAGNYTQNSDGLLEILLGGTAGGTYCRLDVTGNAMLAGTLELNTVDGFTLANGDVFDLLETGEGLDNELTALDFNGRPCTAEGGQTYQCAFPSFFDVFTDVTVSPGELGGAGSEDLLLEVATTAPGGVPEPDGLPLLGAGLAGIWWAARRQPSRPIRSSCSHPMHHGITRCRAEWSVH